MTTRIEQLKLDAYVIDTVMPDLVKHDRRASAFLVLLYFWRRTAGGARAARASHAMVADATGLSKRGAQQALAVLARRRFVTLSRSSRTAAPLVTLRCHWRT